jgi:RNA polymerase sigma factor (sigma-70 family)
MLTTESIQTNESTDARLVAESLAGNREAFRLIVERYQSLVSSLAYSATGNVSQSEDVAQETFLAAWKNLRSLREPEKLRAWLCGIARHRVQRSLRGDAHELVSHAAPLEEAHATPAEEALPSDEAIGREEAAILWRALERIPELYREPLVLFYREHQSIERVAEALDLSADAVKQRLSRGRKYLQEEVQAMIEKTLQRTVPSRTFSSVVLAAMPAAPAATAGAGATMGKSAAAGKSGLLLSLLPFLGAWAGFAAQRLAINATTSDRATRARKIKQLALAWVLMIGAAVGGEFATHALANWLGWSDWIHFAAVAGFWWCYLSVVVTFVIVMTQRNLGVRPAEDEIEAPPRIALPALTHLAIIAGVYLALSSWLIRLAWLARDGKTVGLLLGAMLVLGAAHFIQVRRRTCVDAARASVRHVALAGGVILMIFNSQFEDWIATHHGVSVAALRELRPTWIVPALTFAFVAWVGVVLRLSKSRATKN